MINTKQLFKPFYYLKFFNGIKQYQNISIDMQYFKKNSLSKLQKQIFVFFNLFDFYYLLWMMEYENISITFSRVVYQKKNGKNAKLSYKKRTKTARYNL